MSEEKSFTERVFDVVKKIPKGKVMSYGDVALLAGKPRGARVVGYALHRNKEPVVMPCHRVVFKDGSICDGYAFGGRKIQEQLLTNEGVIFTEDGRVNMACCRFFPNE